MEKQILKLVAKDKTCKKIGAELFISSRTVESHRYSINRKLELSGTLALVSFASAHKSEL
jgi:DNA-binding CsgD family transcriptional regulator